MVIALLTDFGTTDYFVGAMKGAILSINRQATIVDITHQIPPHDIPAASFTLRACYQYFPARTIFVAVVDPGVGSERRALLVETENFYFLAPDNGLLSFVFDEAKRFSVFELTNENFFAESVSRTFHGRDIFAPVAAHLSNGVQSKEFGVEVVNFNRSKNNKPKRISQKEFAAEIVHIDSFGNLVTNLKESDLPESFTIAIGGTTINKRQTFFAEAKKGELFMITGSAGFLEIAAFQASAKEILRVEIGEKVLLRAN